MELEVLTPLYMGGPTQQENRFRVSELKGALRFWYRALDPEYLSREDRYFGGPAQDQSLAVGQSPVLLRVEIPGAREQYSESKQAGAASTGSARDRPGLSYLGYNEWLKLESRREIPAGRKFRIVATLRPWVDPDHDEGPREIQQIQRAWLAALWCVIYLGGLGARSRRGFGSLAVSRVEGWGQANSSELKIFTPSADSAAAYRDWLNQCLNQTIRGWVDQGKVSHHPGHPVLWSVTDAVQIQTLGSRDPWPGWEAALDAAGECLADYRRCLIQEDLASAGSSEMRSPAFGLPWHWKKQIFSAVERGGSKRVNRQPSSLFIRVARLGDQKYVPIFIRLPSPYVPQPSVNVLAGKPRKGGHSPSSASTLSLPGPGARGDWAAKIVKGFLAACERGDCSCREQRET